MEDAGIMFDFIESLTFPFVIQDDEDVDDHKEDYGADDDDSIELNNDD